MKENRPREDTKVDHEQPFVSHLLELRDRLLRAILGVLIVFLGLFAFANDLYALLAGPLLRHLPENTTMIAIDVASPFLTPFKLTLFLSIFIAMPWILYQIWAFVAPGLYRHERRLVLPLIASSTALFYLGMAFAYFVVFPLLFAFLAGTAPEGVAMMTDIARYLDFVLTIFFAFGVAFEVPVVTILLVWADITTPESLAAKRPYVIVAAFAIGMFLTPPDAISQTLLAIPMWLLFELGIFLARLYRRRESEETVAGSALTVSATAATHRAPSPGPSRDGASGPGQSTFRAMSEDEMGAELERIEAEEDPGQSRVREEKLAAAQRCLDAGEWVRARQLLQEVLADGDEDQLARARDLLRRLSEHPP
jgi:sec-independent protein translocase protein TatC